MKKYRLIKWYPGCGDQQKDSIVTRCKSNNCLYQGVKLTDTLYHMFSYKQVENNPEYWQEVIEKDYEILSFYCNQFNYSLEKKNEFTYGNEYKNLNLDYLLGAQRHYCINSIKRLSDGEVFTVGDKIEFNFHNITKCPGIISEFKLYGNRLCFIESILNYNSELKIIGKHIKKPLFTTEDGVDIFEGDGYYMVNDGSNSHKYIMYNKPFTIVDFSKGIDTSNYKLRIDDKSIHRFSTKEAAEEYILMNKPCLSLNDVFTTYPKLKRSSNNIWTKHALELKRLVKYKL